MLKTTTPNTYIANIKKLIKKRYLQIVNVLKKFVKARTIMKQILDFQISLKIGKLLAFIFVIKKQLIKMISKNGVI